MCRYVRSRKMLNRSIFSKSTLTQLITRPQKFQVSFQTRLFGFILIFNLASQDFHDHPSNPPIGVSVLCPLQLEERTIGREMYFHVFSEVMWPLLDPRAPLFLSPPLIPLLKSLRGFRTTLSVLSST